MDDGFDNSTFSLMLLPTIKVCNQYREISGNKLHSIPNYQTMGVSNMKT